MSLRKAGYSVTTSNSVDDALELVELTEPDMVVSDTQLDGKDGFEFIQTLKQNSKFSKMPFVFLSSDGAVESKVRGLELGADEYLTKPVYIREILTRIHLIFQRQEQEGALRTSKTRFAGSLADMGLVDLLQTIDVSRKSGVLHLTSGRRRGAVYFADGRLVDAELGELMGEPAIYRFLVWSEGEFEVDFRDVRREDRIKVSTQGILMEGMRRLDEWGRLQEQLPPMSSVFHVNHDELLSRLAEIPDEINDVLRLFDGKRTLLDVVDASLGDDLGTLNAITKLYFEGFIVLGEPSEQEQEEDDGGDVLVGDASSAEGSGARSSAPGELFGRSQPASSVESAPAPATGAPAESGPALDAGRSERARELEANGTSAADAPEPGAGGAPAADPGGSEPNGTKRARDIARGLAPQGPPGTFKESASDPDSRNNERESSVPARAEEFAGPMKSSRETPEADGASANGQADAAPTASGETVPRSESNVIRFPSSGVRSAESNASAADSRAAAATALKQDDQKLRQDADEGGSAGTEASSVEIAGEPTASEPTTSEAAMEAGHPAEPPASSRAEAPADPPASEHEDEDEEQGLPPVMGEADDSSERDAVETFFSSHPPAAHEAPEHWSDLAHQGSTLDEGSRRARRTTGAIALGAVLLIGGYVLYHKLLMPTPEELGQGTVALPTPVQPSLEPAPEAPEPKAESEERAAPVAQAEQREGQGEPGADETAPAEGAPAEGAAAGADGQTEEASYEHLVQHARQMGFKRDAEKIFMRALAVKPDGADALSGLAMLLLNRGKNAQALERASQAVGLDPKNSEGWIVLGAAHDAMGHGAEARDAYRSCVEQGEGRYVVECRRMLR